MPVALVTGANRGLGFETARQLEARGWSVLLTARDAATGRDAAQVLGKNARFLHLDVAEPASVQALLTVLDTAGRPLDALVNNAAVSLDGFDGKVARRTLAVNYRGAVHLTDSLIPRLAERANVVMVSSGMGELGRFSAELSRRLLDPKLDRTGLDALVAEFIDAVDRQNLGGWPRNAYGVSKAALNAFTRILAREFSGSGRRVNAVCPGWVRTRMGGRSAPRSVERGASGIVWAATLGPDGPSGGFYRDEKAISW